MACPPLERGLVFQGRKVGVHLIRGAISLFEVSSTFASEASKSGADRHVQFPRTLDCGKGKMHMGEKNTLNRGKIATK